METVDIQSLHIAKDVNAFMPAVSALHVVATFRNAGIKLAIADEKLISRITPRSAKHCQADVCAPAHGKR
jgi:hypothetical protein